MSRENVEAFKRAVEASNRHDVEGMLGEFDPDVEWHPAMQAFLEGGTAAVYRGHEGVRAMFRDFYEAFAEIHVEFSEVRDLGDQVVAIGRLRALGKESRAYTESPWAGVTDWTNGKATCIRTFLDPKDALEAAGLWE